MASASEGKGTSPVLACKTIQAKWLVAHGKENAENAAAMVINRSWVKVLVVVDSPEKYTAIVNALDH